MNREMIVRSTATSSSAVGLKDNSGVGRETTSEAGDAGPLCPPSSEPLQDARTAGPPAASLSPSGGSCRGRRGAHVHRPRVLGRSSPPVPPESLHPSVSVLVRRVVDVHHPHPFLLRCLLGCRGFSAQCRLHVGPPFGRDEGPHQLEGGLHGVAVADGCVFIDEGL